MKKQLFALTLSLCLTPLASWCADNFGDDVVRCLAAKGAIPGAPEFEEATNACEREVERARRIASLDALRDKWHVCLAREIAAIDDGVSTASDIATAVQSFCEKEYSAMNDAAPLSPVVRYQIYQDRFKSTREVSTTLVLQIRAAKNKAKQGKP